MTIQEKIEFRQCLPYDAMGDYSVFSKPEQETKNHSIKDEKLIDAAKPQKARR